MSDTEDRAREAEDKAREAEYKARELRDIAREAERALEDEQGPASGPGSRERTDSGKSTGTRSTGSADTTVSHGEPAASHQTPAAFQKPPAPTQPPAATESATVPPQGESKKTK